MATPTPAHQQSSPDQLNSLKSAARKLPIKRKTPPQHHQPFPTDPAPTIPNPNPNPNPHPIEPGSSLIPLPQNPYDDYDDDDEEDDSSQDDLGGGGGGAAAGAGGSAAIPFSSVNNGANGVHVRTPPFKFHRIWSESDEIRFLQGLLGCWSQGLVFPRDLNIFYDRFSESMPQPYTRSQLSEKLRRLRRKFRVTSARIARGQDPNRLAPHDRDLLHLCTRLWDPKHASTSPFTVADPASAGTVGNKRRRSNPQAPPPKMLPAPADEGSNLQFEPEAEKDGDAAFAVENPVAAITIASVADAAASVVDSESKGNGENVGFVTAKTVLDVFDESLKEVRASLQGFAFSGSELARRWQEQRVAELDVFARRMRLVLEQSLSS